MGVEQAYLDLIDSNLELRIKLTQEETTTIRNKEKIHKFTNDLERCELYIKYLEKNLISHEEEIDRLKAEYRSTLHKLKKCQDHLELKEEVLVVQDNRIILLEDTVEKLKSQILKISHSFGQDHQEKQLTQNFSYHAGLLLQETDCNSPFFESSEKKVNNSNNHSEEEERKNMALPDILRNVGTALDRIERYINGDRSFDPRNTLNGIRISLTTVRDHMQRHAQDAINSLGLLHTANGRINNLMNDLANTRNDCLRRTQLLTLAYNNEVDERRRWWQIAQERQTNGQRIVFRKQNQINILLQEKVALQLINRRRKAEADLAEFNRAWVFNRYQKWKARELISRQIILNLQNNPLGNMATMVDVNKLLRPQLFALPFYDGQEEPDSYYAKLRTINESARTLAVAGFNAVERANMMKGKMTGRFHPVLANNPYNANNAINSEAEFLNWLQGKYREVMVGTNRDALKALMTEKFTPMDTSDTYEKRIKPYAQGNPYAEVLPYLYEHMPQYMEMRLRQANPANLDAFFTSLRTIWLESRGRAIDHALAPSAHPPTTQTLSAFQPQTVEVNKAHDFIIRLARDLQYSGISTDNETLEKFIYEELGRRIGGKTAHVRKRPFTPRSTYATKKVVRKVVPKASAKQTRHCSACGKAGHTKVNCPKGKQTKKVNYVYQDEVEDPEASEEEYILEEVEDSEEEESEDDDVEYVEDDSESRNCYAVKKKWCEVEYL